MKYYWNLTCPACPERYDIYRKKGEHYKMGLVDYCCELDECSFKEKKNDNCK